jgi:MFS superfamily sulfate permease-like transporter
MARLAMIVLVIVVMMIVIVIVTMVVAVIVAAAAGVAMLMVMAVRLGIDEGRCELALDRNRHLARRAFILDQQSHHFGADAQIIDGA